jgi:hypothetical protein
MIAARVVDLPLELLQRRHALGDDAEDDRPGAALREDVDAEPRLLRDRVGEVARAVLEQRAGEVVVAAQHAQGDHLGLERSQPGEAGKIHSHQLAVHLDLRRPSHREVQVGDALGRLEHRLQDGVEVEVLHGFEATIVAQKTGEGKVTGGSTMERPWIACRPSS